jgi:lipopolysaccharide biosynthesis glycosyltransferase
MQHNILITPDKNFVQHADVMLTSLFLNNRDLEFAVYIITNSQTDTEPLENTASKYGHSANVLRINESVTDNFKISLHASQANYYRLFLDELLPANLNRILYLDSDLIVCGDISYLFSVDLSRHPIAAVPEYSVTAIKKKSLGLNEKQLYFNSGMMIINRALWKEMGLTKKLGDFINNNPDLIEYWDQDALNAVLQGNWLQLPEQYNFITEFCKGEFAAIKPLVIHYTGKSKPWQFMDRHRYKEEYYKYLRLTRWKSYRAEDATIGNFFRKHSLMPKWLENLLSARHA